ncbi:hypothetical protein QY702_04300 [Xanthomonas campestris pv. plantaginis]|uniref:hypothetical protein n=1 Tax=Xanthomonas campestris TaxID=339 RepID=UPI002B22748D|nr:hypothetical protein [Xanthomonas campestris]MEA9605688.1 hypothetical protein [Xanthomonas campestris pv. plantaginis]
MNAVADFHQDVGAAKKFQAFQNLIRGYVQNAEASTSLMLRQKIDATVNALGKQADVYVGLAMQGTGIAEIVRTCEVVEGEFVDPDLEFDDFAVESIVHVKQDQERLRLRRGAAVNDRALNNKARAQLLGAFDRCIEACDAVIRALTAVMAVVRFHDEAAVPANEKHVQTTAQILDFVYGHRAKEKEVAYLALTSSDEFSYAAVEQRIRLENGSGN